jgi:hypothetical protein
MGKTGEKDWWRGVLGMQASRGGGGDHVDLIDLIDLWGLAEAEAVGNCRRQPATADKGPEMGRKTSKSG